MSSRRAGTILPVVTVAPLLLQWRASMTSSTVGKRVLLVDDDRALLRLTELWLTATGYDVVACDSFDDARQELAVSPPDILVTDVRLGAFNGLHLAILANDRRPDGIAVVMSAYDDPMLRKEAAMCRARYLVKPFTREGLLTAVIQTPPAAAEV
jgi:DNA-binding response OmpR family regulator